MDDIDLLPKDFRLVSDANGNLFLVRKNGETHPVTSPEASRIEHDVSQIFAPLGSGVRVKAPKIFD
jgi:hypothetical protein